MSKSIKLKDNTYLDSSGVIHNKEKLNNILEGNFAKKLDLFLTDKQTKTIEIENNKVYLFINCHAYQRCMLFITTFGLNIDVIFKSSDLAVPTITRDGTLLTITAPQQARGYLFKINDLYCA